MSDILAQAASRPWYRLRASSWIVLLAALVLLRVFNASGFVYLEPRDLGHVFWRRGWPLTYEVRVADGSPQRPNPDRRSELNIQTSGFRSREWTKYTRTVQPFAVAVDAVFAILIAATVSIMFNRRRRRPRPLSFSLRELFLAVALLALPFGYWQYLRFKQQVSQDVVNHLSVHVLGLDHGLPEWLWQLLPEERIKLGDRITYVGVGGFANPEAELRHLGRLTNLRSLHCIGRGNIDAGAKYLAALKQLVVLRLSEAELSAAGLAELDDHPRLEVFHTWSMPLTDAALSHLATISRLEELTLRDCMQVTDAGLAHLAKLSRLEELTLGGCDRISGDGLANLAKLTRLKRLDIHLRNQRSYDGPATLSRQEALAMQETLLTSWDTELTHLRALPNLEYLEIGAYRITDRGLEILGEFPALQTVVLRAAVINDDAVAKLRRARPSWTIVRE